MVPARECLALRLEACEDFAAVEAVEAVTDDLERDTALEWLALLGEVDDAHAAVAELLEETVGTDAIECARAKTLFPAMRENRAGARSSSAAVPGMSRSGVVCGLEARLRWLASGARPGRVGSRSARDRMVERAGAFGSNERRAVSIRR